MIGGATIGLFTPTGATIALAAGAIVMALVLVVFNTPIED
jgi:hypothetical protein